MNTKHTETSIKISDESHTGARQFIPYCFTMGCQWIGNPHSDTQSAHEEGNAHLAKVINSASVTARRSRAARSPGRTAAEPRRVS
ncbi:MAG TPA: hypothetical protein VFO16_07350 [Pseudonocardiaceae bacterium]|nr:hypothetical protein [Pseudonocardiaceae bacterium]